MTTRIPAVYKAVFLYWDPPCSLWGAYMSFFARDYMLDTYFLGTRPARDGAHDLLLYQGGGAMVSNAILNGVLLRYTDDVGVWKLVQAGILAIDLALLAGVYEVFGAQGRLSPWMWQPADWVGIVITVSVTIARVSFIAGLGLEKTRKKSSKKA
ncbi:hypothetical protein CSOJ01_05671 [Colletotrichum sojae]|uniref:DUF7704 domain-containing protein n=1 Tax=Colletotrichum sojae TaxID=2175907 RepID=A0A8H6JF61_9PEZI|nr:hypothetical protein CSOJ01_05671 [Colletotrichum sojae]